MIPPHLLLRDAALLSVVLTVGAIVFAPSVAIAFGLGATAGLLNFGLWLIAGHMMLKASTARAFLPLKLLAAIGMVWALQRWVPGAPAFVGFAVPFVAVLVCSLFRHPSFVRAR